MLTSRRFVWPVVVRAPSEEGAREDIRFRAHFLEQGHDALLALRRALSETDAAAQAQVNAFFREALVGWSDVVDADGAEVPFTDEARDRLVNIVYVRHALIAAYARAMSGSEDALGEARAKNSAAPSASF